jgi:tRNA G46 methylase TrmB
MYTFWLTLFYPPFVPTVNKKVLTNIENYLKENPNVEMFCEPGCGFAGVSSEISKKFPNIQVLAIEYNFFIYLLAKISLKISGSKVEIIHANFLKYDLKKKRKNKEILIYCYLLPELMNEAMKKGKFDDATVITLDFKITNQTPESVNLIGSTGFQKQVFFYNFKQKL